MNIYTITGFQGHYPVGTSAIIVANDQYEAAALLNSAQRAEAFLRTLNLWTI